MDIEVGQIVISKSGRDKGLPFIISKIEGSYLYLVDGKTRVLEKPKKKKEIHVQKTNLVDHDIKQSFENSLYLLDSDVRKSIVKMLNLK